MTSVIPSIPPGRYPVTSEVTWEFTQDVKDIAYSINGLPPAISEYIAYDQLDPPNPFIAVTQDGRGNVLYDGGFPKLYNLNNPNSEAVVTFSDLTPAQKYFHNAIHWCSNPETMASHGKQILIVSDSNSGQNYNVKDNTETSFNNTLKAICRAAGYIPTFKTRSDWGTQINCTLAELSQYACVMLFSSVNSTDDLISDNAVQDLMTYRSMGGGIIVITDHGVDIDSIENAWPVTGGGFFKTANKLVRNFGAWFSGDYDRRPVQVGFLRANYGDHPLYADISDDEFIHAGGSESRVFVSETQVVSPDQMPTVQLEQGVTQVQILVRLNNGEVKTYSFLYNVSTDLDILVFTDIEDNPITEADVGWDNGVALRLQIDGEGQATLIGSIYRNTIRIGEFRYDQNTGSRVTWYAGEDVPNYVDDNDVIRAVIEQPYTYEISIRVKRKQIKDIPKVSTAPVVRALGTLLPTVPARQRVKGAIEQINKVQTLNYTRRHAQNIQSLSSYMAGSYQHPEIQANAFDNPDDLANALATLRPPTAREIFDNWDRASGDSYWSGGVGATHEAAAWYWDEDLQAAVQPLNTERMVSFISDEKTVSYDIAVTFASDGRDDDFNGLILAFHRDPQTGLNHSLSVQLSRTATGFLGAPHPNYAVVRDASIRISTVDPYDDPRYRVVVKNDFDEKAGNWVDNKYRVWASRRGDQFTIYGSGWSTLTRKPESMMSFNLNDHPDLAIFKQPLSYGFCSQSQPDSRFENIDYVSGYNRNVILDIRNQRIYSWFDGRWNIVDGVTIHDIFKAPRIITSASSGRRYQLNLDGTITFL